MCSARRAAAEAIPLAPQRARASLARAGWDEARYAARSVGEAIASAGTFVDDDAPAAIAHHAIEGIASSPGDDVTPIENEAAALRREMERIYGSAP